MPCDALLGLVRPSGLSRPYKALNNMLIPCAHKSLFECFDRLCGAGLFPETPFATPRRPRPFSGYMTELQGLSRGQSLGSKAGHGINDWYFTSFLEIKYRVARPLSDLVTTYKLLSNLLHTLSPHILAPSKRLETPPPS